MVGYFAQKKARKKSLQKWRETAPILSTDTPPSLNTLITLNFIVFYVFSFMYFKLWIYGFHFGKYDIFCYQTLFSQLGFNPGIFWLRDGNLSTQPQSCISYACKLMESTYTCFWRLIWNVSSRVMRLSHRWHTSGFLMYMTH